MFSDKNQFNGQNDLYTHHRSDFQQYEPVEYFDEENFYNATPGMIKTNFRCTTCNANFPTKYHHVFCRFSQLLEKNNTSKIPMPH